MTPTQIARRSDALYADGTCGMTRRVLCDMVAQRESDLEDARAEFDKMDKWHSAELQAAMAENAKLLELLQRTWNAFHNATAREFVRVKNELRELGVEVDDG